MRAEHNNAETVKIPGGTINIAGRIFGRLTVLRAVGRDKRRKMLWLCRCQCGKEVTVRGKDLRSGNTQSCGCLHRDIAAAGKTTHGLSHHPLHHIWKGIITRCTNQNETSYRHYGGRGITICDEWRHDFKAFHDYIIQLPHYGEVSYSLDRQNNAMGYSPGNMRYATLVEQARNRRNNRLLTYNGITKCLSEWEDDLGLPKTTLKARLKRGWSTERALMTPIRSRDGKISHES